MHLFIRYVAAAWFSTCLAVMAEAAAVDPITIDAAARTSPFPHFWETMMGSGRAALSLRDSYRQDLAAVKAATGLGFVRFHAIFHDELGVYSEDRDGTARHNFQYVDQIYDGLLAAGVKPCVELSFMPGQLALRQDHHPFWYHPIVSPPKSDAKWDDLIRHFAQHLIDRYGIDEVASWYFEVWNEANLDFWTGIPKQATYFTLYDHTARALKSVNPRLRVGGPTAAQAAWVPEFIAHTAKDHVPVDFISTHVYGDDDPALVLGHPASIKRYDLVCPAIRKVHDEIAASARPDLPLIVSEFNATSNSRDTHLASSFMGPWLAQTIRDCTGLAEMMSYWTFSDVFEEQGVATQPFTDGFGLMALGGIPKPSFGAFALLHRLGNDEIATSASNLIATKRADGTLVIAAWNRAADGPSLAVSLALQHSQASQALLWRLDSDHGDTTRLYRDIGAPTYPTAAEIARLRQAADLGSGEALPILSGALTVTIPADGLVVIEIPPS
jgi:xylan 1,4-beta-xylosidase